MIAEKIGESREYDRVALALCAYFHDIVSFKKGNKSTSLRSKTETMKTINIFLNEHPHYLKQRDILFDCVISHSYSSRKIPVYIEGKLIQDADKIDALGFTGIARLFMVAGKMNSMMLNADDPLAKNRMLDDKKYALDHVAKKLCQLPSEMNTKEGYVMAINNYQIVKNFVLALIDEQGINK